MKTPDWVHDLMNVRAKEAGEQGKATAWKRMGGAAPVEPASEAKGTGQGGEVEPEEPWLGEAAPRSPRRPRKLRRRQGQQDSPDRNVGTVRDHSRLQDEIPAVPLVRLRREQGGGEQGGPDLSRPLAQHAGQPHQQQHPQERGR